MGDTVATELAPPKHGAYIGFGVGWGPFDDECISAMNFGIQMYRDPIECWGRQGIFGDTWDIRVETNHGEERPAGHSAGVVVAGKTVGLVPEVISEELTCELLGSHSSPLEMTEKVRVGDVGLVGGIVEFLVKRSYRFIDKLLLPAH